VRRSSTPPHGPAPSTEEPEVAVSREPVRVALITEVYPEPDRYAGLAPRLAEARAAGAALAVLPELPLDRWCPATREASDADAEPPGGPREQAMSAAAASAGIGLVGGAIVRDPDTGRRHNTALAFDPSGRLVGSYRKLHLPQEEGFWEASHYEPGDVPPRPLDGFGLSLGLQVCSDANRQTMFQALAALGAELIVAPRCTPRSSYERWKLVLRADAVTTASFVISTNRPGPECGVEIGGPSIAIAPDGEVLLESEAPLACIELDPERVRVARLDYPGYLDVRADLYARTWREIARSKR
jgi:predicted amidohydrolase